MYLGVDIGGTKTLVAALDDQGVIQEQLRFHTPALYENFLRELSKTVDKISTKNYVAAGIGVPGRIDRLSGLGLAFGNLSWKNTPLQQDIRAIVKTPVVIENDANLAGLSEAMLRKDYRKLLYLTISTGIGGGYIVDQCIHPETADSEPGQMLLEHNGKAEKWESFASGRSIVAHFGHKAQDIHDAKTWKIIAHNLVIGFIDLIAVLGPDMIVLGGSVSLQFEQFKPYLGEYFKRYENPLIAIPPIELAARPEEAVIYGCYDLAKSIYGKSAATN